MNNAQQLRIISSPGGPLHGSTTLAGDKSLAHRAALLAGLAQGESCIDNYLVAGVTQALLGTLAALGVPWKLEGKRLVVQGRGFSGLTAAEEALDCGNSATTLRLLAGALAAAGLPAVLDGSTGLRRRPMTTSAVRLDAPRSQIPSPRRFGPCGRGGARRHGGERSHERHEKGHDGRQGC